MSVQQFEFLKIWLINKTEALLSNHLFVFFFPLTVFTIELSLWEVFSYFSYYNLYCWVFPIT